MAQIGPCDDKYTKVGNDYWRVKIVENLGCLRISVRSGVYMYSVEKSTYRKEEIRDIMGDVDCYAQVGEVESITQPNQRQRDYMMGYQFFEIFSWLL